MSVHCDRTSERWVVRWREAGRQQPCETGGRPALAVRLSIPLADDLLDAHLDSLGEDSP